MLRTCCIALLGALLCLPLKAAARGDAKKPLALPLPPIAPPTPRAPAAGTYSSSAWAQPWQVNRAGVLIWDGQPYAPGGVEVHPAVLSGPSENTDANWSSDKAVFAALRDQGVRQVIIGAGGSSGASITSAAPAALQRVIDYLDANGFTYGIDLDALAVSALRAFEVAPAVFRDPAPLADTQAQVGPIGGLTGGQYFLVSLRDSSVLEHGPLGVGPGSDASAPVGDAGGADTVLLAYPECSAGPSTRVGRHCPDFWQDAGSARDDLLFYFRQVQLGRGLRFFVDPLADDIGVPSPAGGGLVPTSAAYRQQFEAWLNARYDGRLSVIEQAWAVTNGDLPDVATAARCVPLWFGAKGLPELFDPTTGKLYDADAAHSGVWRDIAQFQAESLRSSMDGSADAVKSGIADVPVLVRWWRPSDAMINTGQSGYDGLLIDGRSDADVIGAAAGQAVSDVSHARRRQWLVCELSPADAAGSNLTAVGADLRSLGVYGVFARDSVGSFSTSDLRSIARTGADMTASAPAAARPTILYYPSDLRLAGVQPEPIGPGAWWLPAQFASQRIELGDDAAGYSMTDPAGNPEFVVYSLTGRPVSLKLTLPPKQQVVVRTPAGAVVPVQQKHGTATIDVTAEPLLVGGLANMPLPDGVMASELARVQAMLQSAKKAAVPSADDFSDRLYYILNNPILASGAGQATQYDLVAGVAQELTATLDPYLWIEGEDPVAQTFSGVRVQRKLSGGAALWLDSSGPQPDGGFFAQYSFAVSIPGDYDVWASLAPASESPSTVNIAAEEAVTVSIDSGTAMNPETGAPVGPLYGADSADAPAFGWLRLTSVRLGVGQHTLTVAVTRPEPGTGRFTLGLDALCLARQPFHPDGANPPPAPVFDLPPNAAPTAPRHRRH